MSVHPRNSAPLSSTRELVGAVRAVRYHDLESLFFTAQLTTGEFIVGDVHDGEIELGVKYRFLGRWHTHERHGPQFRFDSFVADTPADRRGVVRYLVKETAGKVTETAANRMWDEYGPDVLCVLRENPEQVAADEFLSAWAAGEASRMLKSCAALERTKCDLFDLFHGKGFPKSTIKAAIGKWGARAAAVIRRNPFAMLTARLPGVGFKRADAVYIELGLPAAALKLQMFAAWDGLKDDGDGHTWHVEGACRKAIAGAVGMAAARFDDAIRLGVRARWLETRRDEAGKLWITESAKAHCERRIACELRRLTAVGKLMWPGLGDADSDGTLSEHQRAAVRDMLIGPVCVLGGSPGTGKTYTAAWLLDRIACTVGGNRIAVAAPTGKAAVRITESLQAYGTDLQATTIHRMLRVQRNGHDGAGWAFEYTAKNPAPYSVVVIDESSMIDAPLMASLLEALPTGCHVLFVGDINQLPPVGHGAPLRDMITAGIPHATLTEIRRQDATSLIVQACHAIKDGNKFRTADKYDAAAGQNLRLITAEDPEAQVAALRAIIEGIRQGGKFRPVEDVQVICALNDRSPVSREPLNALLQGLLNPPAEDDAGRGKNKMFRRDDKVICLRNSFMTAWELIGPDNMYDAADIANYGKTQGPGGGPAEVFVANGDQGRVLATAEGEVIARFAAPDRTVKITMRKPKDGDESTNAEGGAAGDFALAYAITGHKSQGSEWPVVVVMLDEQAAARPCSREWLYTSLSRGKSLVLLIGKMSTAAKMCRKVALLGRKTFLAELLMSGHSPVSREGSECTAKSVNGAEAVSGAPGLCPASVGSVDMPMLFDLARELATL